MIQSHGCVRIFGGHVYVVPAPPAAGTVGVSPGVISQVGLLSLHV